MSSLSATTATQGSRTRLAPDSADQVRAWVDQDFEVPGRFEDVELAVHVLYDHTDVLGAPGYERACSGKGRGTGRVLLMQPAQWQQRWRRGDESHLSQISDLVAYPAPLLAGLRLRPVDLTLLTEAGLPRQAAPFLTFDTEPGMLEAAQAAGGLPSGCDGMVEIGATGSGDPICLTLDGRISYLRHDDNFRQVLVNSHVEALVHFLDHFRSVVVHGAAASAETVEHMRRLDPPAMEPDSMWPSAVADWE